uniref:Dynein heavy chain n=1 Tax=Prymnesium polylepis TaxID=72548 RepID=A0A6T8E3I8_9EUKA
MLTLRVIRLDKLVAMISRYVANDIGQKYIEPPPFDLEGSYKDSSSTSPLVFILSPGVDPMLSLLKFAEGKGRKVDSISLGQGQGPHAERMMKTGQKEGSWIVLQNCHLFVSWMITLEKLVEEMDPKVVHANFRLWLTSYPSPAFPVLILQNGVKMTNEPPKGLRANLMTNLSAIPEERFEATTKPDSWRKIMFGQLLFFAVILERRKFGPLGWNIAYEFTDGDKDVCLTQAELLVNDYEVIPYQVISALTSDVNYGGRVTDSWDRRLIANQLNAFVCPEMLDVDYKYSTSGNYKTIAGDTKESYLAYVESLPVNAFPEIFGLHDNADITCAQKETFTLFETVLSLQPRTSSGGGKSRDEVLDEQAGEILGLMPAPFNVEVVQDKYPTVYEESMNTVLQQECVRYNKVIVKVQNSLKDIRKALVGEVVMTSELEQMGNQLFVNQVPELWAKVAYPSMKPLASWVPDLLKRLSFIQDWFDSNKPQVFWISGFYFPQAFITGVMQNHARKYQVPIDTVTYGYGVRDDMMPETAAAPEDGAIVHGLFIEGARWDSNTHLLGESRPKELYTTMPIIHLLPVANRLPPTDGFYQMPVYKTLSRFGVLSTTGHSTNFVMTLEIPTDQSQNHWIKRGVAGVAALNF